MHGGTSIELSEHSVLLIPRLGSSMCFCSSRISTGFGLLLLKAQLARVLFPERERKKNPQRENPSSVWRPTAAVCGYQRDGLRTGLLLPPTTLSFLPSSWHRNWSHGDRCYRVCHCARVPCSVSCAHRRHPSNCAESVCKESLFLFLFVSHSHSLFLSLSFLLCYSLSACHSRVDFSGWLLVFFSPQVCTYESVLPCSYLHLSLLFGWTYLKFFKGCVAGEECLRADAER